MKKIIVTHEKETKLTGFEEVYDLFKEKSAEKSENSTKITNDKLADNYDLYDFLEVELKRLHKLNELLTKKLENLKLHPQTKALNQEQKKNLDECRQRLLSSFLDPSSKIHQELGLIWKTALAYKKS